MHTVKLISPSPLELVDSFVIEGDVRLALSRLPSDSVQCVVTSPPYWGLRDYGITGQIGLEPTLAGFIQSLTQVFDEVKRVLKPDGILWLNMGDGYTSGNRGWRAPDKKNPNRAMNIRPENPPGLKDKDLLGIPWRLALALQDSGWYLRSDIVWHKPNVMPESVKDRPTRAHEYLFMLTKSEHYRYQHEAVKELADDGGTRNRRTVWSINTSANGSSHIAALPPALVEPCVLASTTPGDFVLDPFFGSGTVGLVARKLGRKYVGIELNPTYVAEAVTALESMTSAHARNGHRRIAKDYEHTPALLESSGEHGHSAGDVSPSASAAGAGANHPRVKVNYLERRTRRVRARK